MKKLCALVLFLTLVLALSACQLREAPIETANPTPQIQSTTQPLPTETTEPSPTALNAEDYANCWRSAHKIAVYPFTAEELQEALDVAEAQAQEFAAEEGITSFDIHALTFDPALTDVHVRQAITAGPVVGWTEADYYTRYISFTLVHSSEHDHFLSPASDADHEPWGIHLYRESPEAPWQVKSWGVPTAEHSGDILDTEALREISQEDGVVLSGWQKGNQRALYLLEEETGTVYYVQQTITEEDPASVVTESKTALASPLS